MASFLGRPLLAVAVTGGEPYPKGTRTGTAHGRKGTFVLHHTATAHAGESALSWTILPDSGTGELLGIRGGGQIVNDDGAHSFHLDYELG
ncbi:DUF3224 domain-containing protein [Streptosporangium sp. NBC_01810]|uniref:DUF3224 domain-containing protein n=1 Tax=Streptosporangium sp. NBC_01810 TaxID=2975951 RepID=UPI002DDA905E|nr:DUF3224 domain-containing protein [Streptosporangium sp. NBC_01810]WSA27109.1 DUF3224 domain-containing protein [Streptosporangium sp. NBC_01810]